MAFSTRRKRVLSGGLASLLLTGVIVVVTPSPAAAYCTANMTRWDRSGDHTIATDYEFFGTPAGVFSTYLRAHGTWSADPAADLRYGSEWTPDWRLHRFRASRFAFGDVGWPSTPGMTWRGINGDGLTHSQAEASLNTEWTWSLTGEFDRARQIADLGTVLAHELGHTVGLNDQSVTACAPITSQERSSVMHAEWIKKHIIRPDDLAGKRALYPRQGLRSGAATTRPVRHAAPVGPSAHPPLTTAIDGYELAAAPPEALKFNGNDVVFEAEVLGAGAARSVSPKATEGRLTYTYRPIEVRVAAVHKGATVHGGQTVTLRALGGADQAGRKTIYADAPPESTWRAGTRIVVLGRNPIDVGDGVTAITPNFVLLVQGNKVRDATGRPGTMTLTDLRTS